MVDGTILFLKNISTQNCTKETYASMKMSNITCRSPGTSPTAVPSDRTQMISGVGDPRAAHSTVAPVVLLKSTRLAGSFMNIGPIVSSSHSTDPGKI